ncbi:glycerophosphodiester phosphodiesterase 1-like isoform X2 [Anguilla anguilla]|uniref:glycerophosphodiester phosphodiesterase 1-like isoform X2 n=1 Tax=Anguilla anguilla TaxID=7936 RepID=UPI0015A82C6E|nr:glycerophosphodiester phosphodiesterase 1-like isoform X2 [Anguilla anguilla]
MLEIGDGIVFFSVVFVVVLLVTRSAICATGLTASLYILLLIFRYPQVSRSRVGQVLRPSKTVKTGGVSVVAHRGGGYDAPENTLAAIREASQNGATGVELDLEFTADGVPVLMHDETVDRTTNGSGALSNIHFAELSKLDASANHRLKEKFRGEKVPTLQEAVEECLRHQLTIYFDVKGHAEEMRQADPEVVTALTHRPWSLSHLGDGTPRSSSPWKRHWMQVLDVVLDWAHHHLLWNLCGVSAFLLQKNYISPDTVQYWAKRGVEVVSWTVNTEVEKEYHQRLLNISYITDSLREDCEPHY